MSLLQVFTQWTDVAPVLTKDQHVNYQRGLCDLCCSVMWCDCFLKLHSCGFNSLNTSSSSVVFRRRWNAELLQEDGLRAGGTVHGQGPVWTQKWLNLDCVTSGHCHIWTAAASAQIILFIKTLFYGQFLQFIQWNVVFVSGVGGDDRWVFCHSFCFLSSAHFAVVAPPTSCRWGEGVRGRQE